AGPVGHVFNVPSSHGTLETCPTGPGGEGDGAAGQPGLIAWGGPAVGEPRGCSAGFDGRRASAHAGRPTAGPSSVSTTSVNCLFFPGVPAWARLAASPVYAHQHTRTIAVPTLESRPTPQPGTRAGRSRTHGRRSRREAGKGRQGSQGRLKVVMKIVRRLS